MKVLLGMSGGVDSSAAAVLLKEKGYEVIGISLKFWDNSTHKNYIDKSLEKNIRDAEAIAKIIGIKHYIVDLRATYKNVVVNYFVGDYLKGRTPFPCIICNREMKWPALHSKMREFGCDAIATGHYVNILQENNHYYITKGIDENKDQSFFLWPLSQEILKNAIFPLGTWRKTDVKTLVKKYYPGLEKKKESTGVCFLDDSDYRPFLKSYLDENKITVEKGSFYDDEGKIIGQHEGYPFYTIGQRRGLNINQNKAWYVEKIDPHTNSIVLNCKKRLNKNILRIKDYNVVNKADFNDTVTIKIRYRKQENTSKISFMDDTALRVELMEPVDSVAPGQAAAFYKNNKLLGGGFIEEAE